MYDDGYSFEKNLYYFLFPCHKWKYDPPHPIIPNNTRLIFSMFMLPDTRFITTFGSYQRSKTRWFSLWQTVQNILDETGFCYFFFHYFASTLWFVEYLLPRRWVSMKKFCEDMYTSTRCSRSASKPCSALWDPWLEPAGFAVLYYLQGVHLQAHDHWIGDAIQLSHPVASFSPCLQSFAASRHLFSLKISPMIFLKSTKVSIASIENQTGR